MTYQKKRKHPKKEGDFVKEFMKELVDGINPRPWYFKTHGEPMQARGIPDILCSFGGLFVGIEFKVMRQGKIIVQPMQEYVMENIRISRAMCFVIWFDENNAEVGIGLQRFMNTKVAAQFLRESLDKLAKHYYSTCEELIKGGYKSA